MVETLGAVQRDLGPIEQRPLGKVELSRGHHPLATTATTATTTATMLYAEVQRAAPSRYMWGSLESSALSAFILVVHLSNLDDFELTFALYPFWPVVCRNS